MTEEELASTLRAAGYTVQAPPPPPPPQLCAVCGLGDDKVDYFTSVEVRVAPGEEGDAEERRDFCEGCLQSLTTVLNLYGFSNHKHGGINFLEDIRCPATGYFGRVEDCPTPAQEEE